MINKDEIDVFFKTQNRILIGGGVLSLLFTLIGGLFYSPNSVMIFIGMVILLITFLICHVREGHFRDKIKNNE
jgi:hypothetical protein